MMDLLTIEGEGRKGSFHPTTCFVIVKYVVLDAKRVTTVVDHSLRCFLPIACIVFDGLFLVLW